MAAASPERAELISSASPVTPPSSCVLADTNGSRRHTSSDGTACHMRRIHISRVKTRRVKSRRSGVTPDRCWPLIQRDDELRVRTRARLPAALDALPARAPGALAGRERRLGVAASFGLVPPGRRRARDRRARARATPPAPPTELGHARGYDGVGIGETLDDLGCLYRTLGAAEPPLAVVRALCEGWADAQAGAVVFGAALDPESGLPSRQYLALRLAEAYRDATLPTQRARTVADLGTISSSSTSPTGDVDPFTRAARSAAVGAAMTQTYGDGHPMATLGGGVFAVLARADEDPHPPIEALHAEIDRRCELLKVRASTRQPVRVWIEPLPSTHEQAVRMLDRVAGA